MTRDPRVDPQPGDQVERGVLRRVTEATPDVVGWVVVGMENEAGSCSLAQWRRWARGGRAVESQSPTVPPTRGARPGTSGSPGGIGEPLASATCARGPTLSPRDVAALYAVSTLPLGLDGWRRARFRDQLHETAALSRPACQRAVDALTDAGLVERQNVGRSARLPEGYRLTASGESALLTAGGAGPRGPAVGQLVGQPGPVLGSSPMSLSEKNKEEIEPPKDLARGPVLSDPWASPRGPAPLVLELGPATRNALVAALLGVPLCGCGLPMVERRRAKDGCRFLACVMGRGGCGATTGSGAVPRARSREEPPTTKPRARDLSQLGLAELVALKRAREA